MHARRAAAAKSSLLAGVAALVPLALAGACVPQYLFAGAGADGGPDATGPADASVVDGMPQMMPQAEGGTDAPQPDGGSDASVAEAGPRDAAVAVLVPEGGPLVIQGASVTLTHAFALDRYEVTVGRFEVWDAAGRPPPCTTAGQASCNLDPSGPYSGQMMWDPADWNGFVGAGAFDGTGGCGAAAGTSYSTPTFPSGDDTLPVSCVNWYQAVSFCAFEGRRLPTETEWEYEASGRGDGRKYPWGNTDPTDCTKAVWADNDPMNDGCGWPKPAGFASAGASRDTAFDMSGSVYEWVWDWQAGAYPGGVDYLGPDSGATRGTRGGSWATGTAELDVSNRDVTYPLDTYADIGFRCALTIP